MSMIIRLAAIAQTELRVAARNRWVLSATLILTLFALALVFPGAAGAQSNVGILSLGAASLATLSVYLVPLLALLLSYDCFAGEVERGTMALILATPVGRWELVVGKFLGLLAVLSIATLAGYGIAGVVAGGIYGFDAHGAGAWLRLLATAMLLGAVFIAIGMAISISTNKTAAAAALSVGVWLVVTVLYDLALLAGLVADDGGFFTKKLFALLVVANPGDAFRLFNLVALEGGAPVSGIDGLANTLPFDPAYVLVALLLWLLGALGGGLLLIRRLTP